MRTSTLATWKIHAKRSWIIPRSNFTFLFYKWLFFRCCMIITLHCCSTSTIITTLPGSSKKQFGELRVVLSFFIFCCVVHNTFCISSIVSIYLYQFDYRWETWSGIIGSNFMQASTKWYDMTMMTRKTSQMKWKDTIRNPRQSTTLSPFSSSHETNVLVIDCSSFYRYNLIIFSIHGKN